jgi:epoxyqueuosine reductase
MLTILSRSLQSCTIGVQSAPDNGIGGRRALMDTGIQGRCRVEKQEAEVAASQRLKERILDWGASLVGYADLGGVVPTVSVKWPRAVSIGMALDPAIMDKVRDGPTAEYHGEYNRVNRALNEIAGRTAEAIYDLGYDAEPFPATVPERREAEEWVKTLSVAFQHKTAATRAGLGWIGKNALLVTPQLGPRLRLATVFTTMPLSVGEPVTSGRCGECVACARLCPAEAIKGQQWEAGLARERLVDARLCYETARNLLLERVGARNAVCGVCVAVCPVGRKQPSCPGPANEP